MKAPIRTTLIPFEDNEDSDSNELTTSLMALFIRGSNTSQYHYTKPGASSPWILEKDVQAMSELSHTLSYSYGFV